MFNFSLCLTGASEAQGSFQQVTIPDDADIQKSNHHVVAAHEKRSNLILKRGMITANSPLADWFKPLFASDNARHVTPRDITVSLMNDNGGTETSWYFTNAHPVKWDLADNMPIDKALVVGSIEFAYSNMAQKQADDN